MKKITLFLLTLFAVAATAQPTMGKDRPTVAVVLSGGGAKGVAHISALRAIEQAGIPIDMIVGTSMGSLIGGLYAVGYSTDFLDSIVRAQDWAILLSDRTDPYSLTLNQRREQNTYAIIRGMSSNQPEKGGIIRGHNLNRLFDQLLDGYLDSINFDSLPIRFCCVATDLVTNTEVDFHDGLLKQAMRASMAIPGVFTPIRIGDSVLVDGGLRNNYPADIARQMGADIVIGVSVQGSERNAQEISDAASVISQIIDINSKHKFEENVAASDIFIYVNVKGYSAASFTSSAIDTLIRRGAEEAAKHKDALDSIAGITGYYMPHQNRKMPEERIKPSKRKSAGSLTPVISAGFRFDTEEMGAIQLNAKTYLRTKVPMTVSATFRLGQQMRFSATQSFFPRGFTSPTLSYTYSKNDLNIYTLGVRTHSIKYHRHQVDLVPLNFRLRNYTIRAGILWDHYNFYSRLLSNAKDSSLNMRDNHYFSCHISAEMNTENDWYFPSKGSRIFASYAYHTTNLITFDNHIGTGDINLNGRISLSPNKLLTFRPLFYSRLVFSKEISPALINVIGSEWFGHYLEQQMPFPGIGNIEYVKRFFCAFQLEAQYRIMSHHYIIARIAAAENSDELLKILDNRPILGAQVGYSYSTIFGPIDFRVGWSNRTKAAYIYLNIGHCF